MKFTKLSRRQFVTFEWQSHCGRDLPARCSVNECNEIECKARRVLVTGELLRSKYAKLKQKLRCSVEYYVCLSRGAVPQWTLFTLVFTCAHVSCCFLQPCIRRRYTCMPNTWVSATCRLVGCTSQRRLCKRLGCWWVGTSRFRCLILRSWSCLRMQTELIVWVGERRDVSQFQAQYANIRQ